MKRLPPSVRMKEEVERLLRGETVQDAPAQAPMHGLVRALARHIPQVSLVRQLQALRTTSSANTEETVA